MAGNYGHAQVKKRLKTQGVSWSIKYLCLLGNWVIELNVGFRILSGRLRITVSAMLSEYTAKRHPKCNVVCR